jgi:hypothetical protein
MRPYGYLSFFLIPLLCSPLRAIAAPTQTQNEDCFVVAQGTETQGFGSNGQNGTVGGAGKNAVNADNLTIFADGSPLTLNLAGRDGENGQRGGDATAADCKNQPEQVSYDLRAPDGANGANGGNGGDGGNGGSISIYSTNPSNLRQIFVNAAAGKGGQPGAGGLGSQGCNCSKPYWTVETCSGNPGDPDYRCSTKEFRCFNGRSGVNGNAGLLGRDGLPGKLTWINLNKPLEPDKPSATVTMATLKDQGFTLSKNRWETRQGAIALLAPGSVVVDEYLALIERTERSFLLIWNAPQAFSNFADRNLTLTLNDQQEINVTLPSDIWWEGTTQKRNTVTEFVVYNAILAGDATRLEEVALAGNGNDLKLILADRADKSNLIATKFKVKYSITQSDPRFRPVSDYSTKYTGDLPDDLVTISGDRFTLNIGQLPIPAEYLKPGLGVEIEVLATRTFSGYSANQKLVVTDIIGPSRGVPMAPSVPQTPALPAAAPFPSNAPTVPRIPTSPTFPTSPTVPRMPTSPPLPTNPSSLPMPR